MIEHGGTHVVPQSLMTEHAKDLLVVLQNSVTGDEKAEPLPVSDERFDHPETLGKELAL